MEKAERKEGGEKTEKREKKKEVRADASTLRERGRELKINKNS